MKVLFLSSEQPYAATGSPYALRLAKLRHELAEQGFETDFVSLRELRFSRPLLAHPINLPALIEAAKGCDVIHAGGDAVYVAACLKPFTGVRVVYDVHGDGVEETKLAFRAHRDVQRAYEMFQAWVIRTVGRRRADWFLVVSEPMRRVLIENGVAGEDSVAVVRNGVDVDLFRPIPPPTWRPFVVAYGGTFVSLQAIETLVAGFESLGPDEARLKMVGFTPKDASLKSEIARRLGQSVKFVNRVTQPELVQQFGEAHILLCPRPKHPASPAGFPVKFAEYIAMGKPVIVLDTDETADLVRRHQCGLVAAPTAESLAATIRSASRLAPDELAEMGRRARALAEREFSWNQVGQRYGELLRQWSLSQAATTIGRSPMQDPASLDGPHYP